MVTEFIDPSGKPLRFEQVQADGSVLVQPAKLTRWGASEPSLNHWTLTRPDGRIILPDTPGPWQVELMDGSRVTRLDGSQLMTDHYSDIDVSQIRN